LIKINNSNDTIDNNHGIDDAEYDGVSNVDVSIRWNVDVNDDRNGE
jgi:hypothetical protein